MKRLSLIALVFVTACVPVQVVTPPPPPPPPIVRTVQATIQGPTDASASLAADDGSMTPCTVDAATVRVLCVLPAATPAPFGADLWVTAKGFKPRDYRFALQTFDAKHPNQDLPEITLAKLVTARAGSVHAAGRVFVDTVPFNPLGATFFWEPWGWKFDQARTRANLACLAGQTPERAGCPAVGYDFVRVLGEVGGSSWADRVIDPDWPDYEAVLGSLLDANYADYGLRTLISVIGGGTGRDPIAVTQHVVNVIRARSTTAGQCPPQILHLEAANEDNFNGDAATLARAVALLKTTGCLVAANSPDGGNVDEQNDLLDATGATMGTGHFDRSMTAPPNDADWRQVRQVWDVNRLHPVPEDQQEPAGPQSSVATNTSPLQLAMMRAMGAVSGAGAYVLHTGAGVRGGGSADVALGRAANFWDVPNFAAIATAVRRIEALLPGDVAGWSKFNNGWGGNPSSVDAFWTDGADHGVVRAYTASNGPQFLTLLLGVKNYVDYGCTGCDVQLFDGLTTALVASRHLNAGEAWRIPGSGNADTGYVVVGRR